MSAWFRLRVRADRIVAVLLLVLSSPLTLTLIVAVRISDRGPALIAVSRVGRAGEVFGMWKLRSMRAESSGGRAQGISLTLANDVRITPIGRFLRHVHLDELPQLWNVVRGEMCLLGPRPEAPEYVDLEDPRWQTVLEAPPGIAGPTQLMVDGWERELISAASDGSAYVHEVLPIKLAIDRWYLCSSSIGLDAQMVITLVRWILPGPSPRTLGTRVRCEVPEANAIWRG